MHELLIRLSFLFKRIETQIFLGWILAVHLFVILMLPSLPAATEKLSQYSLSQRFIKVWVTSADTFHYMNVAQKGYGEVSAVFFPLWPLLVRLTGVNDIVAILLASGLTLGFLFLFVRLIKSWHIDIPTEKVILIFAAFPFSFMLLAPMSEPLYLVLVALTILFTEKKNYPLAAVCAALASATRMIGIILVLYILLKLWSERKSLIKRFWWSIPVSGLGLAVYSLYLKIAYGDFLLFYRQEQDWNRSLSSASVQKSATEIITTLGQIGGAYKPPPIVLLHLGAVLLGAWLLFKARKLLNFPLLSYCFLSLFIPLMSGTFLGMPRYLLSAFPLFIPLTQFLVKHRFLFYMYLLLSVMLQGYLLIRFLNYEMVA